MGIYQLPCQTCYQSITCIAFTNSLWPRNIDISKYIENITMAINIICSKLCDHSNKNYTSAYLHVTAKLEYR